MLVGSTLTCSARRSSTEVGSQSTEIGKLPILAELPMRVAILNAGTGFHTEELCRALAEHGHTGRVLPYEGLLARLGTGSGVAPGLSVADTAVLDADAVLARIIPSGSLEQMIYRVDALHWIEK